MTNIDALAATAADLAMRAAAATLPIETAAEVARDAGSLDRLTALLKSELSRVVQPALDDARVAYDTGCSRPDAVFAAAMAEAGVVAARRFLRGEA